MRRSCTGGHDAMHAWHSCLPGMSCHLCACSMLVDTPVITHCFSTPQVTAWPRGYERPQHSHACQHVTQPFQHQPCSKVSDAQGVTRCSGLPAYCQRRVLRALVLLLLCRGPFTGAAAGRPAGLGPQPGQGGQARPAAAATSAMQVRPTGACALPSCACPAYLCRAVWAASI